jgi:hypothetical protein
MILFQVDGRYSLESLLYLSFSIILVGKLKERKDENGKAQNKSKEEEKYAFYYTFRQLEIKSHREICLLKKRTRVTVYN